ncbi:CRISPR-associated endoribonuclease Cas6 [Natronomonas sp. EA1]|uniref:CRISPR-associated endoribonuclease Cas6 n=1 Tax=Natronomonas sp. EA1 TaxID=3421655 RepID=UPI003EC02226
MRLLMRLSARADAAYETAYHHKLRGALWRALEGTRFEELHDTGDPPGFVFSNVFPWGAIGEGDRRTLLVASHDEALLSTIARHFRDDSELNVGEMPFRVEELSAVSPDVGEPGTRGVIETATGVVVRLYDHHREAFGIDGEYDETVTYWRPEHTMEPFRAAIEENAQRKHELFAPEYVPGPATVDGELFDGYDLIKTYSLPVTVTRGVERTLVLSKWRFEYRVRNDTHRKQLNLLLDCGIGGRNALGFGFLNVDEESKRVVGKADAEAVVR